MPASVEKDGVNVIVPATVPVCNPICVPCLAKTALVVFAGITNGTVWPPVANCTAASAGKSLEGETLRVNVPEITTG